MEKKDIELFYVLPYTKKYIAGYHYYNDDICCNDYKNASFNSWYGNSLFFDTEKDLLNYFYQNPHNPIPIVYKIRYVGNFKGLDDVIQITNLLNNATGFYTILNPKSYAYFDFNSSEFCGKYVWRDNFLKQIEESKFRLKDMYEEFSKRGIKLKYNVLNTHLDKTNFFEFIGDPYYIVDAIKMKDKQLILYRYDYNKLRPYEIEKFLKQHLSVEEVNRLLCESENPLQEIFFGSNDPVKEQIGPVLLKRKNSPKHK